MIRYFCTYFDQNYVSKGLALHSSLMDYCEDFRLWVLCMDDVTYEALLQLKLENILPIKLDDFERDDFELQRAKGNRSRIEYYFTCTPSLPLYILTHWPDVDLITYLDADLYFFSSPEPIFSELAASSIGIIEHRFPERLAAREKYGKYNVGWLSFRRDNQALACLRWWRARCIEWCYDRLEDGKFADQKYLDHWTDLFGGVHVIQHKGANVAPWNVDRHPVTLREHGIFIGDEPLIFFHFHALRYLNFGLYMTGLRSYGSRLDYRMLGALFRPYLEVLSGAKNACDIQCNSTLRGDNSNQSGLPQKLLKKMLGLVLLPVFLKQGWCIWRNPLK